MRLGAALLGDLEQFMKDELADAEWAVSEAVRDTAEDKQFDLRADVVTAGLGARMAKTWRLQHYPGAGTALGAASVVYSKAPHLIESFDKGATIKSTNGAWLAVPTEHVPKTLGRGRKRVTPANFPENRFGKLRFVYRKSGPSLLVVDNQRMSTGKRGGYRLSKSKRALKTGNGLSTVIMFFLYPQVRMKRRLNVARVVSGAEDQLARRLDANFRRRGSRRGR